MSVTDDAVERAASTCRDRQRQLFEMLEDEGAVGHDRLMDMVAATACPMGHDLHFASLMSGLLAADADGSVRLGRSGDDWLVEHGRQSPDWHSSIAAGTPRLRAWQDEALRAWCAHGRHGVVEAVTGTGKSRVGIEATREALSQDYSVVIAVPTVDLVDQWLTALRANRVAGVGRLGGGGRASFRDHRVIVGTIQSLYADPPTREDGKVLLVADECHRYGAGEWRRALHPSYRRRLGLTATFERNDDGIRALRNYFGGQPVYRIGFDRAIADGVVAHYDVKLLGVKLDSRERRQYDEADRTARDARIQLLADGFVAEPFGAFLHEVQRAAEYDDDPTISDVARRYLKAFSERIDVMTNASGKIEASRLLAARIAASSGAIVFTRRVAMAEEIALTLQEEGVSALPLHSELTRAERVERLGSLRRGRTRALVAPTVLDEGIDVPDIDLAVVMGGSKSRRQMIQRMGRVLRAKPDGRKATFIVVYAEATSEDLTVSDGAEGCFDLIVASADSVEHLSLEGADGIPVSSPIVTVVPIASAAAPSLTPDVAPIVTVTPTEPIGEQTPGPSVDPADGYDVELTPAARAQYEYAHGISGADADAALRRMLTDFRLHALARPWRKLAGATELRYAGFVLVATDHRLLRYASNRSDALTWDDLRDQDDLGAEDLGMTELLPDAASANDPSTEPSTAAVSPRPLRRSGATPAAKVGDLLEQVPALLYDLVDPSQLRVQDTRAVECTDPLSHLAQDWRHGTPIEVVGGALRLHGASWTWDVDTSGERLLRAERVRSTDPIELRR